MAIDSSSTLLATGQCSGILVQISSCNHLFYYWVQCVLIFTLGSGDSTIKVWDIIKQYCTHNFRLGMGVVSLVKFHPLRLLLFSSSSDYAIRIWDLETSK